ncbi:MarR family transcriptional regulator [Haladaptatus pallidirubidus]|uniref:MarR family transcriptional regulator n=1 Tax=Haladaptatus pallidirubidus TaxID=1008152 RepID=A0AAV3UQC7_9EURY|nr:helix-turn-helix domain-containing protein [Haladaptatus pallidirubidus]
MNNDDALTKAEFADETLLPPRTVHYALTRLEDHDLVGSRFSFADARKRCYSLTFDELSTIDVKCDGYMQLNQT